MLLTNAKKQTGRIFQRRIGRGIKDALLIFAGILMTAVFVFLVSRFETGIRSRVLAEDSSEHDSSSRIQTGLNGLISGVADMEKYSEVSRLISTKGSRENALAGAVAVDRRVVQQERIASGTERAGELGYYAQRTVEENQMSSDEYYTLLQIVEAEATGGDVASKMMVAGVVLNRVRDERFPNTIYDVVWQQDQFQPTSDGRIYTVNITDSTIEAVERVLNGEDYSEGALFFFARDSAEARNAVWFDSNLQPLFEYGGHEYFTFGNETDF